MDRINPNAYRLLTYRTAQRAQLAPSPSVRQSAAVPGAEVVTPADLAKALKTLRLRLFDWVRQATRTLQPRFPGADLWRGDLNTRSVTDAAWRQRWGVRRSWGEQNMSVIADPSGRFGRILRVRYPAGSASPAVMHRYGRKLGGGCLLADLGIRPTDSLRLSYNVRFSEDFDFVKGGKLPGLYGGTANSGGNIPDGTDGFSTRLMWRSGGQGEVYAYLPTSDTWGTSLGRGNFRFQPGKWHHIEQEVTLNRPGHKDGRIRLWVDGRQVLDQGGLTFRTTDKLKIEGLFMETFFGGGDTSWATPKDVHADFANFSVGASNGRAG